MKDSQHALRDFLLLKGWPRVHDFIRFIKRRVVAGPLMDESLLLTEWRQANSIVRELEAAPNDWLRVRTLEELPTAIAREADAALETPLAMRSFAFLPHRWAMLELDRLPMWQKYVDCSFTRSLESSVEMLSDEELLRIAIGDQCARPPILTSTETGNHFSFSSASTDLKVLSTVSLGPEHIQGYLPEGRAESILCIFVGYGPNFMTAVQLNHRIALINGTHRAHMLRCRGVTRAPFVVLKAQTPDDLDLISGPASRDQVEWLFRTPRPPVLADFFDKRLAKPISVPQTAQTVHVELKFEYVRVSV